VSDPSLNNVHILGQPWTHHACTTIETGSCTCPAKTVMVLPLGHVTVCPACGRGFRLMGIVHTLRTGQPPALDVEIIVAPRKAVTP
jgi:hypothetical protein